MQLIDRLEKNDSQTPGRVLRLFRFQGFCWEENKTHNGKTFLTQTEERQSILILAQTAWKAHTFLKTHLPTMRPDRITSLGKVWLASHIGAENWGPPEYEEGGPQ